ncbi:MAG: DUF2934 domain-containing protein [Candidatus Sulfotelmatobacter sp.]
MTELIERKIRLHAQHLYDQRGKTEGLALQDWVEAESEVLENSILAPLYRRTKAENPASGEFENEEFENSDNKQFDKSNSCCSEAGA